MNKQFTEIDLLKPILQLKNGLIIWVTKKITFLKNLDHIYPRYFRIFLPLLCAVTPVAVLLVYIAFLPAIQEGGNIFLTSHHPVIIKDSADNENVDAMVARQKNIGKLQRALNKLTPSSSYLLINTSENKFQLYSGKKLIREGICSTGSYTMLVSGENKKWIFKTPKGIFRIRDKKTSPVWKKPDWAFVEEGLPIPPPNHDSRFEYGTLGDYALSLGDGYMIHGTLYQRFLGLPVTHGCVRLGDDDLEKVYHTLSIGSKVYIF
ncbi:MAG: L,D-transpeptidase [Bacteroidales bacterium]|nr:L,D-transpeptidase [Bacteroidales bacterium]